MARADSGVTGLPGGAPVKLNTAGDAVIPMDNADSWIVGSDRMDRDTSDASKDFRAFFNKVRYAFRAGRTTGTQWDGTGVGTGSAAFGTNNRAQGNDSFACGELNQASGARSHVEGQLTTASAFDSHAEGQSTTASGESAHAEGLNSLASGSASHAEGGYSTASGNSAHAEGRSTTARGDYAHAQGEQATAPRYAQHAQASGQFAALGDAQISTMVFRRQTMDATSVILTANGSAFIVLSHATLPTNVLTITASRAYQLKVSAVARRTDVQGEGAGWTWEGLVMRDSTGSARIIGTPLSAAWGETAAAAWDLSVSINTTDATNNYLAVTATGEAGKTIRWVAKMEWVEVGG